MEYLEGGGKKTARCRFGWMASIHGKRALHDQAFRADRRGQFLWKVQENDFEIRKILFLSFSSKFCYLIAITLVKKNWLSYAESFKFLTFWKQFPWHRVLSIQVRHRRGPCRSSPEK